MQTVQKGRCDKHGKEFLAEIGCSVCNQEKGELVTCRDHGTRFHPLIGENCPACFARNQQFAFFRKALDHAIQIKRVSLGLPKNKVEKREKAQVTFMEARLDGSYMEKTVEKRLWIDNDCGYVWQMKHEAVNCAHKGSYEKRYGGRVINGEYKGTTYTFEAVRKEEIPAETPAKLAALAAWLETQPKPEDLYPRRESAAEEYDPTNEDF